MSTLGVEASSQREGFREGESSWEGEGVGEGVLGVWETVFCRYDGPSQLVLFKVS
jgi:hypothetical protein